MSLAAYQAGLFALSRPEPIRQSTLLMTLATGLDDPQALMGGLRAICDESRPAWERRIHALIEGLQQGLSVSEVLANDPKLLPASTMTAIHVAEKTGGLRQVLADEAIRVTSAADGDVGSIMNTLVPVFMVGLVALNIVSFIMIFIIPKFKKIFEDFNTDLPQVTIALIDFSDWLFKFWYLLVPFGLTTVVYFLKWQHGWLSRRTVPLEGFFRRRWTPHVLRMLGHTIAAEGDLNEALNKIRDGLPEGRVARHLSAAQHSYSSGSDLWDSLREQGFLSLRDVAFLQTAKTSGHADWGLLHLSKTKTLRQQRWVRAISQVLPVCVLLAIGVVVMFICVALFLPLVKLLNDLA